MTKLEVGTIFILLEFGNINNIKFFLHIQGVRRIGNGT